MKFNRLRLKNFGIFYGIDYDFDLSPKSAQKKVVLFGGKNGSGKTTILEAIRLALYGPLAFGFKVDSPAYLEKVAAKLNSHAIKAKETKFQIILDVELVENFEKRIYIIRRSWEKYKNSYKERLEIESGGVKLTEQELDIFQTKLREDTPPQLLELLLFDGEKISQVVSENSFATYLKESARVMFNLDLFESLELDLTSFLKSDAIYNNLSHDEQRFFASKEELAKKRNQRLDMLERISFLALNVQEKEASLAELERQFDTHGGLQKEQREILYNKMKEIDFERISMMDRAKETITTFFPFMLVQDNLRSISTTMMEESRQEVELNMSTILDPEYFQSLVRPLLEHGLIPSGTNVDDVAQAIYSNFIKKFNSDKDLIFIHHASYEQRAQIDSLIQLMTSFNPDQIVQNFNTNTTLLKEVLMLRKKIDDNDSTSELKDILKEIHNISNEIDRMSLEREHMETSINLLEEEIAINDKELELLGNKFMQSKKAKSVLSITDQVINISKSFRELQTRKKLQQVEIESAKMLNYLFRKQMFVVKVWIHPDTFEIQLFNSNGEEVSKEILSAGEKQLLLLSIIWAMSTCSKRRLPFVFDTLLGRLDQSHKKSLIEQFLPRCGEQVVILSTDSEIDQEHFQLIKSHVAQTYTIEFNKETNNVQVSNNYFGEQILEVNPLELSTQNL